MELRARETGVRGGAVAENCNDTRPQTGKKRPDCKGNGQQLPVLMEKLDWKDHEPDMRSSSRLEPSRRLTRP